MSELLKLALALAEGVAVQRARPAAARICYVAFAALCAVAALACALAALWIYALPYVGAAGAPLVVAGVLLVLVLALLALRGYAGRRRLASPEDIAATALLGEVARLVKEHKGAVLIAALFIGLLAGTDKKKPE